MIIQIYNDDMLNGTGLREVIFLQGCHHHCEGCFSPETWKFKKNTKESVEQDKVYIKKVEEKLKTSYIDGITITGGDPMAPENQDQTLRLCKLAKKYNKTVWIYSGYSFEELIGRKGFWNRVKKFFCNTTKYILKNTDVLIDGKFDKNLKSPELPWVGSSNQRVIDVQKSLTNNNITIYDTKY